MLFAIALPIFFSCSKLNDLIEPKTDVEKLHSYINKDIWTIDSIRIQKRNTLGVLVQDSSITAGTVSFSKIEKDFGFTNGTMTRVIRINGIDSTITNPYRIAETSYIKLYFPNPNPGLTDVDIIYDIKETSNNKFTFIRDESLVGSTGGYEGNLRTVYKLKK